MNRVRLKVAARETGIAPATLKRWAQSGRIESSQPLSWRLYDLDSLKGQKPDRRMSRVRRGKKGRKR